MIEFPPELLRAVSAVFQNPDAGREFVETIPTLGACPAPHVALCLARSQGYVSCPDRQLLRLQQTGFGEKREEAARQRYLTVRVAMRCLSATVHDISNRGAAVPPLMYVAMLKRFAELCAVAGILFVVPQMIEVVSYDVKVNEITLHVCDVVKNMISTTVRDVRFDDSSTTLEIRSDTECLTIALRGAKVHTWIEHFVPLDSVFT